MRGITKRFPGVLANDAVDFEAAAGEVHALLGENGAGKSTLSNILTGLYRPDDGEIELYGEPVQFHSPRDAHRRRDRHGATSTSGSCRRSPSPRTSSSATTGTRAAGSSSTRARSSGASSSSASATRSPSTRGARIWQLSVGEQQRVEILKALYREARILILDEPTAVLTPQEAEALFETLRAMAAEGRTVIFISHKLNEVKAVADRVTVLRGGRTIATVDAAAATPRELAALMVGREVELAARVEREAPHGDDVALEVEDLQRAGRPRRRGRQGRLARRAARRDRRRRGVAGNGQRELAEAITGIRPPASGTVLVDGRQAALERPALGDRGRCRARPGGPARHRRRAEPQHLRELRAQVVPGRDRLARPARCSGAACTRHAHELIHRYSVQHAGTAPRAHATSRAATSRSSCSAASSRASRGC